MTQLHFAGAEFRTVQRPGPVVPGPQVPETGAQAAHKAVQGAEMALLEEQSRPSSREHWNRMAHLYEKRAASWRHLAEECRPDPYGHSSRAMALAADADQARAWMVRERLGVSG